MVNFLLLTNERTDDVSHVTRVVLSLRQHQRSALCSSYTNLTLNFIIYAALAYRHFPFHECSINCSESNDQ